MADADILVVDRPRDIDLSTSGAAPERLTFTGSGGEYFRIWIVNLLLTIVTLGIYSAWAKVRKMRYLYANTQLAGSGFDYHGKPFAILKGRMIAAGFIVAYNVALQYAPVVGALILALLILLAPWLVWKSLQFKLFNSSYRGIRFGFRGSAGRVYFTYLLLPIVTVLSVYLLAPYTHRRMKKLQHEESRFGATYFSFHGSNGAFYKAYLLCLAVALAGVAVIAAGFGGTVVALAKAGGPRGAGAAGGFLLFVFALYLWLFALFPIFLALLQNLVWNNTSLDRHRFTSAMQPAQTAFIALTNVIGIVVTLGLYTPFAQIRMLKYRIEAMTLIPGGSLDDFVATTGTRVTATGEGVADLLGFDLSL